MKREELRYILRREFSADTDKFQIIKEVLARLDELNK